MRWPYFVRHLQKLPCDAEPIEVDWVVKEGGIRVYGWTDAQGAAFLSLHTLNRLGKVTGSPSWLRRRSFKSDIIVGFIGERPLIVHARATAIAEGLELVVRLPHDVKAGHDFIEQRFTPWGSDRACFSLLISPRFEPLGAKHFPKE